MGVEITNETCTWRGANAVAVLMMWLESARATRESKKRELLESEMEALRFISERALHQERQRSEHLARKLPTEVVQEVDALVRGKLLAETGGEK